MRPRFARPLAVLCVLGALVFGVLVAMEPRPGASGAAADALAIAQGRADTAATQAAEGALPASGAATSPGAPFGPPVWLDADLRPLRPALPPDDSSARETGAGAGDDPAAAARLRVRRALQRALAGDVDGALADLDAVAGGDGRPVRGPAGADLRLGAALEAVRLVHASDPAAAVPRAEAALAAAADTTVPRPPGEAEWLAAAIDTLFSRTPPGAGDGTAVPRPDPSAFAAARAADRARARAAAWGERLGPASPLRNRRTVTGDARTAPAAWLVPAGGAARRDGAAAVLLPVRPDGVADLLADAGIRATVLPPGSTVPAGALALSGPLAGWAALPASGPDTAPWLPRGVLLTAAGILLGAAGLFTGLALRRADREVRTREGFVRALTHELRTPLTSVRMFAETLQMDRVPDEAARTEALDLISREASRMTRLMERVGAFARMDDGTAELRPESTDPAALARDVLQVVRVRLEDEDRAADLSLDVTGVPDVVRVDPEAVREALLNLVHNAVVHGAPEDGGPARVTVRVRTSGPWLFLDVMDEGPGIPPDERDRIFEPFHRGARAQAEGGGMGLGLAIAAHVARAHGGRLRCASREGAGTRFTLELPVHPARRETAR